MSYKRLNGLLLALSSFFFAPSCKKNGAGTNTDTWTTYNYGVVDMAFDAQGNKWFTTNEGILKFDGTNWTFYNTANSGIVSNRAYFDGLTWTTYTAANSGLANNQVRSMAIDPQGNKWFGTDGGVVEFDDTHWTTYSAGNSGIPYYSIFSIVFDAQGNKWIGTAGGGVSEFDGTHWITYDTANSGLVTNGVLSMAIDGNGNKWIGTFNGVSKFDGTHWTTYNTSNSEFFDHAAADVVIAVDIDAQGGIWFGGTKLSELKQG